MLPFTHDEFKSKSFYESASSVSRSGFLSFRRSASSRKSQTPKSKKEQI